MSLYVKLVVDTVAGKSLADQSLAGRGAESDSPYW